MDVLVENYQDLVPINISSVEEVVRLVLDKEQALCDEINIYFVDVPTICELHDQHFNLKTPTDCISIQVDPIGTSPCFLGEVYISPQAAIDYCQKHSKELYPELTLYLIHGILHLLGYDDLKKEDIAKMRLAEKTHIDYLLSINKMINK